jgi:hypothetical protein
MRRLTTLVLLLLMTAAALAQNSTINGIPGQSVDQLTHPAEMVLYPGNMQLQTNGYLSSLPLTMLSAITIKRIEWQLGSEGVGCTQTPILTLMVGSAPSAYTVPMTTIATSFFGHVDSSLDVPANTLIQLKTTTPATCTTQPNGGQMVLHYVEQP